MGKPIFIETLAIIELHIKSNNRTNLKTAVWGWFIVLRV